MADQLVLIEKDDILEKIFLKNAQRILGIET